MVSSNEVFELAQVVRQILQYTDHDSHVQIVLRAQSSYITISLKRSCVLTQSYPEQQVKKFCSCTKNKSSKSPQVNQHKIIMEKPKK